MTLDLQRLTQARQSIQKDFFSIDGIVDRLELFISMNEQNPRSGNIIFFGPGGYGKTEIAHQYLANATGQEPFIVNMNRATTFSDIAGGIDVKAFGAGDGIHYLLDNSFMEYEWVIFEEGLEPQPRTLSALKYIISSGVFAAPGTMPKPIKTKGIIVVTNIDTASFMEADDTAAFLERFPLTYRVSWDKLNQAERYQASLRVVDKFDIHGQLGQPQRNFISENAAARKLSPRMIARIVQGAMGGQAIKGGGKIIDEVFKSVCEMYKLSDQNLSERMEQERVDAEIKAAREMYSATFEAVTTHLKQFINLNTDLSDPRYILKVGAQIGSTLKLLDSIGYSVVDLRTNSRYGNKGDELGSWINGQIGALSDDVEEVKRLTWAGMLRTIEKLINLCERNGVEVNV